MFIHYRQLQLTLPLRFEQLLTHLSNYVGLMTHKQQFLNLSFVFVV